AEVMELYEMRAVLEGTAARLAARMASDIELQALRALNADFASAKEARTAAQFNRQFQDTLIGASRNRFLLHAVEGLRKTMLIIGPTTMSIESQVQEAVTEHEEVIAALQ